MEALFRRIVVCLDGSELGERALPHALAVARALAVPVTLLRVIEGTIAGEPPLDPLEWDLRRREACEYLDRLAGGRSEELAPVDVEVVEGRAAEQICLWAEDHGADLTALCSHGIGGATGWSLAGTARKLIEGAPGSLLLVPAKSTPAADIARYRRVLVAVDGSARAESVLPLAAHLVAAQQAELLIAHVVPVPELTEIGPLDAEDLELRNRLMQRNERVAHEYLDGLRARLAENAFSVRVVVLPGKDVRSRLACLIEDEAVDLVVLSAHGRSARADVSCGSVTTYLMDHCSTPLLIVRPHGVRSVSPSRSAQAAGVRLPAIQATP